MSAAREGVKSAPRSKPASLKYLGALKFEAWPEAVAAIGTAAEWANLMQEKANSLVIGLHVLTFDDAGLAKCVRGTDVAGAEIMMKIAEWMGEQAQSFRALADLCEAAEVRVMAACARVALEQKQKAAGSVAQ